MYIGKESEEVERCDNKGVNELEMVIFNDDCVWYTNAPIPGSLNLRLLPIDIDLPRRVRPKQAWSGAGINKFHARPSY